MGAVIFNTTTFRALFPAFADTTKFPNDALQAYFDTATIYVNNQEGGCFCGGLTVRQLTYALNLMTAHLAALGVLVGAGQTPGLVQQAQIDKVNVSLTPPPMSNQWQWWLSLTPYGQQLLALLQAAGVGGTYVGGNPVLPTFRGVGVLPRGGRR